VFYQSILIMSGESNESSTFNYNISGVYGAVLRSQHHNILFPGGLGGTGGMGHGRGGSGGTGGGPTVIFDHSTNKMYVGEVLSVSFPQVLSHQQQCSSGSRVNQVSCVEYFSS
jgi:hypothetical protein